MSKKVNVFGKAIPLFVVCLMAIGLVSAALISYFGVITGTVTLTQGLFLDNKPWDDTSIIYSESLTSLEEKTVSSGSHQLKNTANVVTEVKLTTTCDETSTTGNGCDDVITTPVFTLSIPVQSAPNLVQDRVVAKSDIIIVNDIIDLSFDYMLTKTTSGNSPYFVLALDTDTDGVADDWAISWQDTSMAQDTWHIHGTDLQFHIVSSGTSGTCTQASPCKLEEVKSVVGSANVLEVKAMIGFWGDTTATTALVKNIKVSGVDVVDNGLIISKYDAGDPEDIGLGTGTGNTIIDFSIKTDFPKMMKPDTYTITTTVEPVA